MVRLEDLRSKWWAEPGRRGQGVVFLCPHCASARGRAWPLRWLCVAFANPVDGGRPWELRPSPESLWRVIYPAALARGTAVVPPGYLWQRRGETFRTLTLSPSVDASRAGCWHGFVRGGCVS